MAGEETIGRATIQLGADGSKLAPEMAAQLAKAQGQLARANKQMERAQASVTRQIQGHIDKIKATKPTNEIRLLEQAIQRMGGTSKLSAGELKRVTDEVNRLASAGAKVPKSLAGLTGGAGGGGGFAGLDSLIRGDIRGAAASLGPIAVAAGAAAGAVGVLGNEFATVIEKGDRLKDLASKTGFSTDALQKLEYASKQVGVAFEQTVNASRSLQRRLIDMPDKFEKIGLNVEHLIGLEPDKAFAEVAAAIAKLPTQAEKSAAAMNLLGDAGTQVLPLLNSDIAAAADEAERLGIIMDKSLIDASDRLSDSTTRLSEAWAGFKAQLVGAAVGGGDAADGIDAMALSVGELSKLIGAGGGDGLSGRLASLLADMATFGTSAGFRSFGAAGKAIAESDFLNYKTPGPSPLQLTPNDTSPLDLGPATEAQKEAVKRYREGLKEVEKATADAKKSAEAFQAQVDQWSGAKAQAELDELAKVIGTLGIEGVADVEALRKKIEQLVTQGAKVDSETLLGRLLSGKKIEIPELDISGLNLGDVSAGILDISDSLMATGLEAQEQFRGIAEAGKAAGLSADDIGVALEGAGASGDQVRVALEGVTDETVDWDQNLQNVSNLIQSLPGPLQGVAGILQGITSGISGILSSVGQIGKGSGLSGLLSSITGIGGIATAAFSVVGPLLGKVKGLFGGAQKEVNDVRDAFFEAEGGFEAFALKMSKVSSEQWAKKLFDAKSVEEFNALVKESQGLLDIGTQAQEELGAALSKYGFDDQLAAAKELKDEGGQLFKEWELLTKGGLIPANDAIMAMGPNLAEFVNKSIAAGQAIPEAMRPMVDQLIASGQLVDENGNAFESAEAAGVTFAKTMTESMMEVVDSVKELVAALTGVRPAPINIPVNYTTTGSPTGGTSYTPGGEIPKHGRGGFFDKPHLAIVGDRPEYIIPATDMGPGALMRAARPGGFDPGGSRPGGFAGGFSGAGGVVINMPINESAFQSAESRRQLRSHTLKTVERETGKYLATLVREGRA